MSSSSPTQAPQYAPKGPSTYGWKHADPSANTVTEFTSSTDFQYQDDGYRDFLDHQHIREIKQHYPGTSHVDTQNVPFMTTGDILSRKVMKSEDFHATQLRFEMIFSGGEETPGVMGEKVSTTEKEYHVSWDFVYDMRRTLRSHGGLGTATREVPASVKRDPDESRFEEVVDDAV